MATNNTVNYTINLNGNAHNGVVQLSNAVNQTLNPAMRESESLFKKVGNACFWLNSIFDIVGRTVGRVVGKLSEFEQAGRAQAEAETKLAQVSFTPFVFSQHKNKNCAVNPYQPTPNLIQWILAGITTLRLHSSQHLPSFLTGLGLFP